MWKTTLKNIREEQERYGEKINEGISINDELSIKSELKKLGSEDFLNDYEQVLLEINGLDYNGYVLYGLHLKNFKQDQRIYNIIEMNAIWHDNSDLQPYIFLGESNLSWYVFDTGSYQYLELDNPSGEIIETFETLNALLNKMLDEAAN